VIISPPFLSTAHPQQNDSMTTAEAGNTVVPDGDVCAPNMLECAPGNGAYPVSFNLGWHGGAHLMAPADGTQPASVRAIADGRIVYVRHTDATRKPTLQYRNVRTDDGCVVVRHDTEIGEGDNAKVSYYSVYMHLQQVLSSLVVGKRIYRKDLIGTPGQIYGQYPQIHFEIVCDEANLRKLIGRAPAPLGSTPARTDAVYGDAWFFVPRGARLFASEPHPYREDDSLPAIATLQPQPPLVPAGTSRDLVIRMRYEKHCTLTTYEQNRDGSWTASGAMPAESEAEYNLYRRATGLHRRYTDSSLAPIAAGMVVPSPSAIFEMLRFGRCINDQLASGARFNHWRKVKTPEGAGWINLSKANVRVYSDADFPEWAGWSFINDDPTPDSLCHSPTLKRWLDVDRSGQVSHADAVAALGIDAVRQRLAHAVCKFPSEWSRIGLEARYNWLKSPHEALSSPLSEADFNKLMDHARDLAFWEDVSDPDLPQANEVWHWPPTAFIRHMRACNWFSKSEFSRIYPAANASAIDKYFVSINKTFRKYRISNGLRQAHFLAQSSVESGQLRYMSELYNGDPFEYFRRYERAKNYVGWLGNVEWNDGGKFRGRGFKQLTGRANYGMYFTYRGWLAPHSVGARWWRDPRWWGFNPPYSSAQHANLLPIRDATVVASLIASLMPPVIDDPEIVANDPLTSIDTAGFFWANNRLLPIADSDNVIELTNKVRGDNAQSASDFPEDAHFDQRQAETARIKRILL
jgi:hydroxyethylthiazole kinase